MITEQSAARRALQGAGAGIVATTAMSGVMWLAQRAGWLGEMPPKKIVRVAAERTDAPPDPERDRALGGLLHYAIGAGAASLYALAGGGRAAPRATGIGFGLLVWATGYLGLLPAARVMPMPSKDRRGRPATMIVAHVVYGYLVGRTVQALAAPADRREEGGAAVAPRMQPDVAFAASSRG